MKHLTSLDLAPLPRRPLDAHKGSAGKVLVVAGSWGMAGAAYLGAAGALSSGAGYVRVACPESIYSILATLAPTAVFLPLACGEDHQVEPREYTRVVEAARLSDVAAIGCGLGETSDTQEFFAGVIAEIAIPCVIDASALTLLSRRRDLIDRLPDGSVLTPHPAEMARLLEIPARRVLADRAEAVRRLADISGSVAVLKGARTLVCDGERIYENTSGNAGMASAGTGDVLAGVVASLAAQGASAFDAACRGVYIHGKAGDLAAAQKGRALGGEDLAAALPAALLAHEGGRFEGGV